MTNFVVVHTKCTESAQAGQDLGLQMREALPAAPDVVLLFAAPCYQHADLLQGLKQTCNPRLLLGCSSGGEFSSSVHGEGLACAIALMAGDMQFAVTVGYGLQAHPRQAARQAVAAFQGLENTTYPYRTALVFIDALHGCVNTFIEYLTDLTQGTYQLYGGGAGDNAQFRYTPVFVDTDVLTDAAVVLEILSHKPIGIGAAHSWCPNSERIWVTAAEGLYLQRLNDRPAIEAFQLYAARTFQDFDIDDPAPFFLKNILGIEIGELYHLPRFPISVCADGSVYCAAEIPPQSSVHIMTATRVAPAVAATEATRVALRQLYGCQPAFALFLDCVASRLRLGDDFHFELSAVQETLGSVPYVGCNTHGQVVRVEGQHSSFLHCTAVACVFPQ